MRNPSFSLYMYLIYTVLYLMTDRESVNRLHKIVYITWMQYIVIASSSCDVHLK